MDIWATDISAMDVMAKEKDKKIDVAINRSTNNRRINNRTINVKNEKGFIANRAGSYLPKGGHSATQTELKV